MPVRNAEDLLSASLASMLDALTSESPELEVTYHICGVSMLEECPGEVEVDEEGDRHLRNAMYWRLSLFFDDRGRHSHVSGLLPYDLCADGDTEPLEAMVERMLSDFQFGRLLTSDGLSKELEAVATEVEGGDSPH